MKILDIRPGKENLFYSEIGKRPIFVKFYMDGCPHCENMKHDWAELEKDLISNYDGDFTIMSVNARTLNTLKGPIVENVQGFPSIFIINSDGTKGLDYNDERTKSNMLNFLLHNNVGIRKKQSFVPSYSSKHHSEMHSFPKRKNVRQSQYIRRSRKSKKSRKSVGGRKKRKQSKKYSRK